MDTRSRAMRMAAHLVGPLFATASFFVVAATPVEVLGCRNRGLLAVAVVGVTLLASLASAIVALVGRARGRPGGGWWIASAVILAVPAVGLLILA
jgi:hypothetical protein